MTRLSILRRSEFDEIHAARNPNEAASYRLNYDALRTRLIGEEPRTPSCRSALILHLSKGHLSSAIEDQAR
jgi:hypothetical protein